MDKDGNPRPVQTNKDNLCCARYSFGHREPKSLGRSDLLCKNLSCWHQSIFYSMKSRRSQEYDIYRFSLLLAAYTLPGTGAWGFYYFGLLTTITVSLYISL